MKKVKLSQLHTNLTAFKSLMAGIFVFTGLIFTGNAFGQITQVGTAQTNTGTNTVTINKPAGVQVNDLLIATISYNEISGGIDLNVAPTGPSSWVLIQDVNLNNSNGNDEWRGAVFYKVAVASDVAATNYLFTLDSDADGVVGGIVAFRNVSPLTPFDVAPGTINVTNSSTITATDITTVNPNSAILMLAMVSNNNGITNNSWTTTSPGALTELFDAGTTAGNNNQVGAAWAIKATAGVTGNGTATMGASTSNGGILLALRSCTPPSITPIGGGASTVCVGAMTPAFTDATLGGVWSIINGTGSATIAGTGIATGVSAGSVTVVYTVTESSGCTSTATAALTVNAVPSQPSAISGPVLICPSSTGNAYSVTNVAGVTYTWSVPGAGWSITSGQGTNSITLTAGASGTFPQTLTVIPSNGCGNGTSQNLVINQVTPGTIAKGSNPGPACGSLDPGTTGNTDGGTGTSYLWEQSPDNTNWSNATGTITNSTYNPPNITTTTYYRRVRISGSCALASNVLQYIVNPFPTVLPIGGGTISVCAGSDTPPFTDGTPGGVWSSSNTGVATILATGVAHGVAVGNANIIYTVTDVNGCSTSVSTSLNVVSGNPAQPSVITPGFNLICPNSTGNVYSVTNVIGITYNWTITGVGWSIGSGQGTNSITLNSGTTFPQTLTVTPTNACGLSGTPRTLVINQVTPGVVSKGASNPGPACASLNPGATVNTDGGTGTSYLWQQSTDNTNWSTATGTSTGSTYDPPNLTTTTYYRRLRITGTCQIASNVLQYVVNPNPVVPAIGGGAIGVCVGSDTPAFTNSAAGGVWSSSNTGIATINASGIAHGVAVGNVTIIYTITDVNGCSGSSTKALVVQSAIPAQPSTITGGPTACDNDTSGAFSVTNVAGVTYTWTITGTGWSIASGQGTNSVTLNTGATFPQTLTVTPSNGCGSGTPRTLSITNSETPVFCTDCNSCTESSGPNPDLVGTCPHLKVALVIDESGSINGSEQDVEDGVMAFVTALSCVGVELSVIEFSGYARYVLNGYQVINDGVTTAMQNYFDNVNNPLLVNNADYSPNGATNYQAALLAVDALSPTPDLILFFTDGIPTAGYIDVVPDFSVEGTTCGSGSTTQAAELGNAMKEANKLKCEGAHIFVYGVGGAQGEIATIESISGPDAYVNGSNTISTADYATGTFTGLEEGLASFVEQLCPFSSVVNTQNVCPNGTNGSFSLTVPSQLFPFNYEYFNDVTDQSLGSGTNVNTSPLVISNLAVGSYRLEVEVTIPGSGCTRTETFFFDIFAGAVAVTASITDIVQPNCADLNGGSATLTITAGQAPYTIILKKGGITETGYPVNQNGLTYTATGLDFGSYTFELVDANLCNTDIDTFILNEPVNCCAATCPADIIIECSSSTDPSVTGSPTNTVGCGTITYMDDTSPGTCPVSEIITRTWSGSISGIICIQVITIEDHTGPIVSGSINPSTIEGCIATDAPGAATTLAALEALAGNLLITDACAPDTSLSLSSTQTVAGTCPIVITRTYYVTDPCNNTSVAILHMINVNDTTLPVIDACAVTRNIEGCTTGAITDPPFSITSAASTESVFEDATNQGITSDACGITSVTYIDMSTGTCPINVTRKWTISDACGNSSTCIQTITVDDNTPPVIDCPIVASPVECPASPAFGSATATDVCDASVDITFSDVTIPSGICPQEFTVTRTWIATDDCGNTATCSRTIVVEDNTPPVITCPTVITPINCPTTPNFGTATATDACDADVGITFSDVTIPGGICPQEFTVTRTWTATDDCGNSATCSRTIVVEDNTAPVIICPNVVSPISCPSTPAFGTATATDACDADVSVTFSDVTTPSGICPQEYSVTRTWIATDDCGNSATCSRTIVVEDNTAPVITCPTVVSPINCPAVPSFGTATATDACDASVDVSFSDVTTPGACSQAYSVTRTWIATDDCGNSSSCSKTIVVQDNIPPVLTCPNVTTPINCPAVPSFGTATATDACDASVDVSFSDVTTPGACSQAYSVTRTWIATDDCGNSSSCSKTIVVQDNIPPVLTCPNVTSPINCPSVPVFGAATATDACDVSVNITFSTVNIPGPCAGTFSRIRTWTATDDCGNTSTCSRTIVVQDITPPVITCPSVVSPIDCPATPVFGTATATDGCDASVAITFSDVTTPGACSQAYSVTRTWIATDDCGNSSTCSKTIVVQDITPPVITCPNVTSPINCPAIPVFGAATATDACDATVAITFSTVMIPGSCPQSFSRIRTWTATDDCGNTSTCSRTIVVQDISPPVITCPADITIVYPASTLPANTGSATATDVCDSSPTLSYTDSSPSDICASENRIIRTWKATDACGNSSTCVQSILNEDRGSICGSVHDDLGQPLSGIEIRLEADVNGNGVFDGGDTLVAVVFSSAGTGNFCFLQLRPCKYILVEIQPATYGSLYDYDLTPDPDGDDSGDGPDNQIPVTLSPSEADADNNFVDIVCPTILPVIPPDTICANGSVVFQIADLGLGALTYSWNFGSGSTPLTGLGLGPISVNYVTTTNNQANGAVVSMTISKAGCPDLTGEVSHVEINPYPNAAINGSTATLCYFANRTFQPVAAPIPGATYQWTFGPGAVPLTASGYGPQTVYYTTTGVKTVKLVIHPNEPGAQCPDSSSISFNVITCFASIFGSVKTVTGVGIGSVTLNLYKDVNVDGIPDDTIIIKSAITASSGPATGNYSMTSITPGNYVLIEDQPLGWLTYNDRDITEDGDLFPNIDSLDNLIPVTLGPSESDGGNNFKESPAPGSITGYVFNDINADTLPDVLEGLSNVTLSLFHDNDKNGHADSPVPITTQLTDAMGFYAFVDVPIGNYVLAETQPIQYVSIKDYDYIVDLDSVPNTDVHNDTIPVTILNGELDDGNYFAEVESFLEIFCPPDTTINCQSSTDPMNTGFATTSDNCEGVIITHSETSTQNPDENLCSHYTYVITRTWEATDDCGDFDSCIQIIQVQDITAPAFTFCPPNSTIDCPQIPVFGIPIVSDACDPNPDVIVESTVTLPGGGCPQEYSMRRTWFAIDACGNSSSCSQTIQVRDLTPPLLSCPANITINCDESTLPSVTGFASATDLCTLSPVIIYNDFVANGDCPEEFVITRTWTATDECLNSATCNQLISVQDTLGPVWLTPVGGLDTTLECSDVAGLAFALTLVPIASDVCSSGYYLFPFTGPFVAGSCPGEGSITKSWYVKDACNNASNIFYQTITIVDTTAPEWLTMVGGLDTTLECNDVSGLALAQTLFPQAIDNCDNNVSNIVETSGTFIQGLTCPQAGTYTNTWIVTDDCGNTSSVYTQTITIIDTTPPVWLTISGALDRTLECSDAAGIAAAQALFPVASDNCDNNVVDIVKVSGPLAGGICPLPSSYMNTWTVNDDCGNTSAIYTQTITLHDTSPPLIICPVNVIVSCEDDNSSANTGVASATDNCSGVTITQSQTSTQSPDPDVCGHNSYTITRTWKATDACGNTSTCDQLITVQDVTSPLITCPANVTKSCQEDLSPSGTGSATSTDNCDLSPAITSTDVSTQDADVDACGHYSYMITRTWKATDACGNTSTCEQVITIQDITSPLITCPADVTKNCQDDLSAASTGNATATDNCDSTPAITSTDVSTQDSDPEECGHYSYTITRTWKATDACGNTSTCNQVITVQDITSPLITCPADVIKNCQDDLSPSGTGSATATDNCDSGPVMTSTDVSTQDSDPGVCGHYSYTINRTWKATDACGNTSTCNQVITVQDVTSPLITCPANVTKECQDDLSPLGTGIATATDNCDSNPTITSTDVTTQEMDAEECGDYSYTIIRTWKATDVCGNMSTCDQVITVQDITPPLIACPADVTKNCQDDLSPSGTGSATATDNCSGVLISQSQTSTQNPDPEVCEHYTYTITRTWKATDVCGNTSTCNQVITVQDNTPPLVTCPSDVVRNCQDDLSPTGTGSATATDNCSGVTISQSQTSTQNPDPEVCEHYTYTITRTWKATDVCGNTSTCNQLITVQDITSPLITCPSNVTKNCQDDLSPSGTGSATATDNCDSNPTITSTDVTTQEMDFEECGDYSYTIIRTWKATDVCGNMSTCDQIITVQDITPPLITCPADVVRNCQDDLSPSGTGTATATDNCSGVTITQSQTSTQDPDPEVCGHYSYTITRTWKATDVCGNTSTCNQVITVQDVTSPLITCPINVTRACQDDLSPSGTGIATATDNCDSNPTITSTDVTTQEMDAEECGDYSYTIIRTWKATDVCGNMSTCDQVITVQDITPPLIACPADVTKNCQDDLSPSGTGTATATDNCSGVTITQSQTSTQNPDPEVCEHYTYTITRTWKATDVCGNTSTCNQVITVQDITSPLITCPADVTKNCQDDLSPSGTGSATATDNCDSNPTITSTDVTTQEMDFEECGDYSYTIIRTWKATDVCGNMSTCDQVITVQDITPPLIACPADVTKNCQDDLSPSGTGTATATDNCSGVTITQSQTSTQDPDPEVCGHYSYTITRTWKATDVCGNTSTCNQVITVQDVTSPLITCPINVTRACQDDLSPSGTGIATATDNCDSNPTITSTDVTTQEMDAEECGDYSYTIIRTWKATDVCGNMSTCDQVITVQDITPPLIACPADVTKNCQDDLSPSGTGTATATDNCSGVTITQSQTSTQNPDPEVCEHYTYTITRTWKATDVCGNTSTCNQVITVQDVTSPLITCPINVTRECQDDLSPSGTGSATATDNCDSNPTITSTDVTTQEMDFEECGDYSYTIIRTWKATDVCGNMSTCDQIITVQDITPPLIACPADVTKNCQDDLSPTGTGSATATDNCSGVTITQSQTSTQDPDPEVCGHYSYTITRTWKATDVCGNTSTCNQVITVQDVTSPLITCPINVTRECQDDLSPSGTGIATATDNCDSNPTITSTDVTTQEMDFEECGDYSYTIIRTWKATDVCGNMSTCDQVITVQDNTPPLIACPADVTKNCQDDLSPSGTGTATATDNCSGVTITQSQTSTQNPDPEVCEHYSYTITRTWKATDVCGNTSTCNQVITVQDLTSPLITCPINVTRACQDDLSPSGTGIATATDNCDSNPTITSTDVTTQEMDAEECGDYSYTIIRTWKATDVCGNMSTCDQIITVQDNTPPLITCPADVVRNCQDDLSPSGTGTATATDNCSGVTITQSQTSTQDPDPEVCGHYSYTITRTWKATDVCGNTSTCNQVITVQDLTSPLITCPINVTRACQDDLSPSGTGIATATDNCDSNPTITSTDVTTQEMDFEECGDYSYTIIRTWKATDVCGNMSTCDQIITVQDITPPLITCPADVVRNCQDDLSPSGTGTATATDNCSGVTITQSQTSTQDPDPEVCGHYSYTITRTWKATDVCGNTSTCNQVITVQDVTSPLITCPINVTRACQDDLSPSGTGIATATDNCDSNPTITSTDVTTQEMDFEECGNYSYTIIRTWKATDVCGNMSTCDQVITVQDITPPLIACPADVTKNCQDDLSPSGTGTATATDNCSGVTITQSQTSTQDPDPEVCGHYSYTITRTWKATDVCGNTSTCNQVITVQDLTSPLITCPINVTRACQDDLSPSGTGIATATDNCDSNPTITSTDVTTQEMDAEECGDYSYTIIRTWKATDVCGNMSTCDQVITVQDNTPPLIACPADVVRNCQDDLSPSGTGSATATDNCSGVTISQSQTSTQNPDPEVCEHFTYTITRTWKATDVCGNTSTCNQVITVQDITSPLITCPADVTKNCQDDLSPSGTGSATATDNCDSSPAITSTDVSTQNADPEVCGHYGYIITRTWKATDACGNTSTCNQVITVQDVTSPLISCPADVTKNCQDDLSPSETGIATAIDNCDSSPAITSTEVSTQNADPEVCEHYSYTITRTWKATDACGNTSTCNQLITVQDITSPLITCPSNVTKNCQDDLSPFGTGMATATDICDSSPAITSTDVSTQNADTEVCGHYTYTITRTWQATDACGNTSTCNQVITVQDVTAPLITCPGNVTKNCHDDLSPSGTGVATATDICDSSPAITSTDVSTQNSDPEVCGHYSYTITRTWKATDACGNTSTCNQVITVQDVTTPLITCPANVTKNCQDDLSPSGTGSATATDNCDSSPAITSTDVSSQDADPEVCGHYSYTITRTWKATDACGNTSICDQMITVQDVTSPLITCPSNVTKNCQDDLSPSVTGIASAIDNCDSNPAITSTEVSTQNPDPEVCGHYSYTITRTWRATDACGNTSICDQVITVQDVTSPLISCPSNVTKNCQDDLSPSGTGIATANDNCDSSPAITSTEVSTQNTDPEVCGHYSYTITRTWRATDVCGNTSTCNQVIIVQDVSVPLITCPADITINYPASTLPANTGQATSTDNCDQTPAVSYVDALPNSACPLENRIVRTWIAVDGCGNSSTCLQSILIEDRGSICGSVHNDLGQAMAGVEIRLEADVNNNQIFDGGDTLVAVAYSAVGTGQFCFLQIRPCNYVLVEIQPATYGELSDYDTSPDTDGDDSGDGPDNQIPVTLSAIENDMDNNFVDIICPTQLPVIPYDTICANGNIVFQINDLNLGALTYSWNFGSGSSPSTGLGLGPISVNYVTITNNQANGAVVSMTISKAGCPDLSGQVSLVEINPYPNASINASTTNLCYFDNRTFQPTAPVIPGATYQWNFGVNAVPATATGYGPHSVYYPTIGSKTVKLVIHPNEPGAQCPDSSTISFNVITCLTSLAGTVKSISGAGIGSITLNLYKDNNFDGIKDDTVIVASANSVASGPTAGAYSMTSLTPGNYVIVEEQPSAWLSVGDGDVSPDGDIVPNIDQLDNLIPVTLHPLISDLGNNFTERIAPGTITGSVFVDLDTDQFPDGGEGLPNVTIGIYRDSIADGHADNLVPIATQLTDPTGFYSFSNIPVGHYLIAETQPVGYDSQIDIDASNDDDLIMNSDMDDDTIPVTILAGELDDQNYFIEDVHCNLLVTNTLDSGDGSLRAAIECAEDGDTIKFDASLSGMTINITSTRIIINKEIVISSSLSPRVTIASQIPGLFEIQDGVIVEFRQLDIVSGLVLAGNMGASFENRGSLKFYNIYVFRNPLLPAGEYLIRNTPNSNLVLSGSCYFEMD